MKSIGELGSSAAELNSYLETCGEVAGCEGRGSGATGREVPLKWLPKLNKEPNNSRRSTRGSGERPPAGWSPVVLFISKIPQKGRDLELLFFDGGGGIVVVVVVGLVVVAVMGGSIGGEGWLRRCV